MTPTSIAGIILAIGTAYNYIVTAKVKAKQGTNNERIESLEKALHVERDTVKSLREEIERLRQVITELTEELRKKQARIEELES